MKIKTVKRLNLPETNSSSSHSISISTEESSLLDKNNRYWDLEEDEEGYIHIPGDVSFDQNPRAYNSVLRKVQYACGLIRNNREGFLLGGITYLNRIQKLIVDFTGCKGVIFDWLIGHVNSRITQGRNNDKEDDYYSYPEYPETPSIDHQSLDNFDAVWENDESLKNFIFNRKSILFIDSDGNELSQRELDIFHQEKPNYTLKIDFGDPIGVVEFEKDTLSSKESYCEDYKLMSFFQSIYFDYNQKKFLPLHQLDKSNEKNMIFYSDFFSNYITCREVGFEIVDVIWLSVEFITKYKKEVKELQQKYITTTLDSKSYTEQYKKLLKDNLSEGENYVLLKLKVFSNEFGEI